MKKTKKHPKHTAWSFSRWQVYERCPQQALFKNILKYPEGERGPALVRGEEIHRAAENYVLKRTKTLSPHLRLVAKDLSELRQTKASAELEMSVTSAWTPTGWFAKDAWGRAKLDAYRFLSPTVAEVVDFKTGKYRPGDEGYVLQLELYGVFSLATFPKLQEVQAKLLFTDHGKTERVAFKRSDETKLRATWEKRITPMMNDEVYAPRPGEACRWCAYKKSNGGPCAY